MHWKKVVKPDSPYFGEQDFETVDQQFLVTIRQVKMEEIKSDRGTEIKGVVHFEEDIKPLILNVTNGKTIAKLYGKQVEGWAGKQITLFFDPSVKFGRERVGGVRVSAPTRKKPNAVKCADCGNDIEGYGRMTGLQTAEYTKGKYGRPLCSDCAKKAAEIAAAEEEVTI